jgi:hypothetical protein
VHLLPAGDEPGGTTPPPAGSGAPAGMNWFTSKCIGSLKALPQVKPWAWNTGATGATDAPRLPSSEFRSIAMPKAWFEGSLLRPPLVGFLRRLFSVPAQVFMWGSRPFASIAAKALSNCAWPCR